MSDYKPITGELRAAMCEWGWVERDGSIMFTTSPIPTSIDAEQTLAISGSDFDRLCDSIDAIHAQLERENAELKAKLDRVTGEQEEHTHARGESITDELRKWGFGFCGDTYDVVTAIADRIDAEHEAMLVDARKTVYQGYIELPKDADGEPIYIGDALKDGAEFKSEGVVECLMLDESGWFVGFGNGWTDATIHEWHHHHAPTVEDVLREFADEVQRCCDTEDTIAEYAAKLRLAGDE